MNEQDAPFVEPLDDEPISALNVGDSVTTSFVVPPIDPDSPYRELLQADRKRAQPKTPANPAKPAAKSAVKPAAKTAAKPTAKAKPTGPATRSVVVAAGSRPAVDDDRAVIDDVVTGEIEPIAQRTVAVASGPISVAPVRAAVVDYNPEPSDFLTAERLLEPRNRRSLPPESGFNLFLYRLTFGLVNRGDSPKVRAEKEITARIGRPMTGQARFIPVLTRKGGVGKTTTTVLLGMALAQAREDRVVAIDANPDRGTLIDRVQRTSSHTVRDVVRDAKKISGYTQLSRYLTRDRTRLDVLASDSDPKISSAFDDSGYDKVADIVGQNYSIVLTDCGTGIVHAVMKAVLGRSDSVVVVTGASLDEVRLAAETLDWLEQNGYQRLVANAVVAINLATQGAHVVRLGEIEEHFASRVRAIVRIPYDSELASGNVVTWQNLSPLTRRAARELALRVVEGLPE